MVPSRCQRIYPGLIRKDKDRAEEQAFERLKAELVHAFAAPEADYQSLTADDIIARNRLVAH